VSSGLVGVAQQIRAATRRRTLESDPGNHFRVGLGRRNFPEPPGRVEQYVDTRHV